MKIANSYYDLITLYDNGIFTILNIKNDPYAHEDNGFVKDIDNIIIKNIIFHNKIFNVIMGYKNGALYFKSLY